LCLIKEVNIQIIIHHTTTSFNVKVFFLLILGKVKIGGEEGRYRRCYLTRSPHILSPVLEVQKF